MSRQRLVRRALGEALRLRRAASMGWASAVCVEDLAERLGLEVRFVDIGSLEGAYVKHRPGPLILISSLRPAGRRAYTAGHELGHHVFGHGSRWDVSVEGTTSPNTPARSDEFLADVFSGLLLMPPSAVRRAFAIRNLDVDSAGPEDLLRIASWFGVGYSTLVHHLRSGLRILPESRARGLLRTRPKDLRVSMLGSDPGGEMVVVDEQWVDRPVDMQVGDTAQMPPGVRFEGPNALVTHEDHLVVRLCGTAPGVGRVENPTSGWAAFVRVSRKRYVGRSLFRHLEDPDHA